MFADAENDDYNLLPSSPCIGTGRDGIDMGALPYGTTAVDDFNALPETALLIANYPNPFNASTTINLSLPGTGYTDISIVNILGQNVKTIYSGSLSSGNHNFIWKASNKSSTGIYFVVVKTDTQSIYHRMLLLK